MHKGKEARREKVGKSVCEVEVRGGSCGESGKVSEVGVEIVGMCGGGRKWEGEKVVKRVVKCQSVGGSFTATMNVCLQK